MKLSIVVPVHNEEENVEVLIHEIAAALRENVYEMIFVDDGSTDQTLNKLQQLMSAYPSLRVLQHRNNCGQSRAIHTGVKSARFDWIVTLDGDGQNDPADIPKLIATLAEHSANHQLWMIAGFRYQRQDTRWRRFSSKLANIVRSNLLQDNTPDTGCGLKLFLRDRFLDLPYFDHCHRFLPALMQMAGGEVISIKVNHRPRHHGRSKYGTLDRLAVGIVDLLGVIWLKKRHSLPIVVELDRE